MWLTNQMYRAGIRCTVQRRWNVHTRIYPLHYDCWWHRLSLFRYYKNIWKRFFLERPDLSGRLSDLILSPHCSIIRAVSTLVWKMYSTSSSINTEWMKQSALYRCKWFEKWLNLSVKSMTSESFSTSKIIVVKILYIAYSSILIF